MGITYLVTRTRTLITTCKSAVVLDKVTLSMDLLRADVYSRLYSVDPLSYLYPLGNATEQITQDYYIVRSMYYVLS
jgi:hypothetical protein